MLQEGAEKEVNDGSPKSGGKKQEKASEKMNDAKEKLSKLKKNQKKKQKAEDAKMMRRLLENVIFLSFEQEKILEKTKTTSIQSPSYLKLIQYQQKIKEDFKLVEDTLYKIASRQAKIRKFIFEEVDKVNSNTDLAIKRLVDRRIDLAISNEQFTMSAYNKLGLMLSESLKICKMRMKTKVVLTQISNARILRREKEKKSMSLEKLGEMQQQLNEQLQQLQKKMKEKSQQPGKYGMPQNSNGQPPGEQEGQSGQQKGQDGNNGKDAAEFAKIAAQQQAIRNLLKKIEEQSNSPDKSGKKPFGNELKDAMDKMKQTERDLVNKRYYDEMMKRQIEIQVKLFESAKAEREQDEETRRESDRAKNVRSDMPQELKQYIENKKQNEAQIQRTPVGLSPYFKRLSEKYFQLIK